MVKENRDVYKRQSVYYINATQIALEIGLGNRTNTILQSAFFRITGVIPVEQAVEQLKKFIVKSYGKKGEDVVNKNYAACLLYTSKTLSFPKCRKRF